MNYTTTDYLEQLQQDRSDLVDNLEAKGITGLTGDETFTELVPEVLNIPSGGGTIEPEEKDVNFYDYDGTRVYSYTKSEFLNLSAMPENPEHDGLTSEGWNWTLEDAKTDVTELDKLDIGQVYIPTDSSTRIYVSLPKGKTSPYVGFALIGSATIDWGDGTTSEVTGSSKTTIVDTQHNYAEEGNYVISIKRNNNQSYIYFKGASNGINILKATTTADRIYSSLIYKVELGYCYLYEYCFESCRNLKNITISNSTSFDNSVSIQRGMFQNCSALESITFPIHWTNYLSSNYMFNNCYSLKKICFSKIRAMYDGVFSNCYSLKSITFPYTLANISDAVISNIDLIKYIKMPKNVSNIGQYAFNKCYGMIYYDFSNHSSIPSLYDKTSCFAGIPANCKIIVPNALYNDWIAQTYWSYWASYIIRKSDWDSLNS